jgi:hypothetical protein
MHDIISGLSLNYKSQPREDLGKPKKGEGEAEVEYIEQEQREV